MGSKMVVDRQKSSESVQAALATYKGAMVSDISAVLGADVASSAEHLLNRSAERLKETTAAMIKADDDHQKELSDDDAVLVNRDERAHDVYASLAEFREVGAAVYGEGYIRKLGFDGATPQDPVALERLTRQVLDSVAAVAPPTPKREALTLNAEGWTKPLSASRQALAEAISAVALEKREADMTMVAKNDAMSDHDKVFSVTATLVSAMLSFAGQKDLAKKVRPSTRRAGQTTENAEPEEPGVENVPA